MKKLLPIFLSLFLPLFARSASAAAFSPLQIGYEVKHAGQLVDHDTPIIGLRLNLPLSHNDTAVGLDIGLASWTETFWGARLNIGAYSKKSCNGLALGLVELAETFNGIQLGVFDAGRTLNGIQFAGFGGFMTVHGIQISVVSLDETVQGLQIGIANRIEVLDGLQIGLYNNVGNVWHTPPANSGTVCGVQIGIVNRAESLHGLQIGLVNIVTESDYPCLPLLRASF